MNLKHLLALAAIAACGTANAQVEAGDYFFQNVESGAFLNGANDWGTKASATKHGQKMTVAVSGSGYTIDSHISNGGDNHFIAAGDNTYADAAAAVHTFELQSDGTYAIKDTNGKYLVQNDGTKVNFAGASVTNAAKWNLISMADVETLMGTATVQAPVDATYYIGDANFSRNNQYYNNWVWAWGESNNKQNHNKAGNNDNNVVESFHAQFSLTQTLTVPNGIYAVTAQGFYRQDGTDNENLPYFFANDEKVNVPAKTGSENSMANASTSFTGGLYTIDPIYVQVTDGTLKVGVSNMNNDALWVIFDNFEMKYYGDVTIAEVLLAEYVKAYNEAMDAAKAVNQEYLSEADKAALNTLIEENTVELSSATQEQLETATANLNAAVPAYAYKAQVAALAAKGNNTDFTSLLVNPSFEVGNTSGWTDNSANGMWTVMTRANATDPKVGNYWIEKYGNAGKIDIKQTVTGLPAGHYRVSVLALDQASKVKLVANSAETAIVGGEKAEYSVDVMLDDNADLTIGMYCETHQANSWVGLDDFKLTYVSSEFPALPAAAEGKMNVEIAAAQTAALNAYNAEKSVANYNAASAAIAAANKSVEMYANNKIALEAQKALMDATNVYDAAGFAAYSSAYEDALAAYEDGTATEVVVNPTLATAWHASTDYNFLLTPWTIGGAACNNFDTALHLNTWSVEGNGDGTNFTTPFFEYWGADAESLADNTLSAKVEGVENGIYSVSAWVRVRAKNGVTATEATGITLSANGSAPIDVTEGAQVGTSQFTIAQVEVANVVVNDGTLSIDFNVEGANISWLSFKNVKYTKQLTKATMAVNAAAKYGTFCAPFDVDVPAGVTASTATLDGTTIVLESVGETIPANTPVILESESGLDATTFEGVSVAGTPVAGVLTGVYEATTAPSGSYVLQNQDKGVAFYLVDSEITVPANRAYLTAPTNTAKALTFSASTAIKAIDALTSGMAEIYSINGAKQNTLQKGINIVNGVKVLVK